MDCGLPVLRFPDFHRESFPRAASRVGGHPLVVFGEGRLRLPVELAFSRSPAYAAPFSGLIAEEGLGEGGFAGFLTEIGDAGPNFLGGCAYF